MDPRAPVAGLSARLPSKRTLDTSDVLAWRLGSGKAGRTSVHSILVVWIHFIVAVLSIGATAGCIIGAAVHRTIRFLCLVVYDATGPPTQNSVARSVGRRRLSLRWTNFRRMLSTGSSKKLTLAQSRRRCGCTSMQRCGTKHGKHMLDRCPV